MSLSQGQDVSDWLARVVVSYRIGGNSGRDDADRAVCDAERASFRKVCELGMQYQHRVYQQ